MMSRQSKFLLGLFLVIGFVWVYQTYGTATIAISSEPSGAVVRVDGRQRGLTPLSRLELDLGNHRLEVAHTHYATYTEGLSLRRGDHLERRVKLQPGEGTFKFLSNPKGAWVEVDGERLPGRTPLEHKMLSGPHVIAMGQQERYIVEETHTLKAGASTEVNFNLNIDPHGSVTMITSPRKAKIEFMGEDIVYTPKLRIQIGEYAVRVSAPGYISQEFRYTVRYGNNLHEVNLQRDFGTLRVTAQPADAEIQVSYTDRGRKRRISYAQALQVPVGNVEIRARALGYRTGFKSFWLGNQGASARFSLEKIAVTPGEELQDTLSDGSKGPAMVIIPAGSFLMGDANGPPSERPARTVTLTQPFAVAKYETSVAEYLQFAEATGRSIHEQIDQKQRQQPMRFVSFRDASDYARWLSKVTGHKYRLLSESEWEYVARAGTAGRHFFGTDENLLCDYANVADKSTRKIYRDWETVPCNDGFQRLAPVGALKPNPFGLYDIYGNVSEWILECGMPGYDRAPTDGAPADEGDGCGSNGVRGGSWDSLAAETSSNYRLTASSANDDRGIRLLREL